MFLQTMATASAIPPTVNIWQPLAFVHLHSARMLCEKAVEVEASYDDSQLSLYTYWAHVTGSIFAATAFLEALINETFVMAVKRTKGEKDDALQNLDPIVIASLALAWEKGIAVNWNCEPSLRQFLTRNYSKDTLPERWYILNKYQLALYLADKPPYTKFFEKTGKFWEDLVCLKDLRNSLTHHAPEIISFPPSGDPYEAETQRTTTLLRDLLKRNLTSGLYGRGSILSFLGSKCANWALELSTALGREFRDRMTLDPASIPGL
jgi:hypothetical protein